MRARLILAILVAVFAVLTLLDRFTPLEVLLARITLPLFFAVLEAVAIAGTGALLRRARSLDLPLDYLLGYPVFGTLLFLIGLLKIATWTMVAALGAGAAVGVFFLLRWYGERSSSRSSEFLGVPRVEMSWPAVFVALVLVFGFLSATRTPSSASELAVHLAIPHTWALEGRAVGLPLVTRSHGSLGIESADLIPFTLLGRISAGLASHFLHWLSAVAATLLIVRRRRSWLATAAVVTTPALVIAAGWSLPDWPLLGLFVALYAALEDDDRRTASAATAAGLLTSYLFLPFAVAAWAIKRRVPHWIAAVGLVFFIRNFGELPDLVGQRALALADYVLEMNFLEEALGASIVALPLLASGGVGIAAALLALALFFLTPSARFLVPFLGVATISATGALQRRAIAVLVAVAVALQTFIALTPQPPKDRPVTPSIQWLNSTLPRDSRTLVIGANEPYSFTRRVRSGETESLSRYFELATPEAVRERLRSDGITHVAVIGTEDDAQQPLAPEAQRRLAQTLDQYAGNVISRGDVTLFALR